MPKAKFKIRNPIRESEYRWRTGANGERFQVKSCPRCSKAAGQPIYHPLEDFGDRRMGDRVKIQSYCKRCRSDERKEAQNVS